MIELKHGLVCFTVDHRLALRCSRTSWLQLCYELRLFVRAEIVSEELGRLQLFADDPQRHFGGVEQVLVVILFLEQNSDWFPFAEAMVAWVGHHD